MEVKVNREIRDYSESVFFGMSLRQCAFAAVACAAAVGVFFAADPVFGLEVTSWLCILVAVPLVALGFLRWHGMAAEQIALAWIRSELLTPKVLLPAHPNTYAQLLRSDKKRSGSGRRKEAGDAEVR